MSFLVYIPVFFVSYALYTVFTRLARESDISPIETFLFSLFCAPIALSLLIYHLLFFCPCRSDAFYVIIISAVVLIAFLFCLPARRAYFHAISGAARAARDVAQTYPIRCAILLLALTLIAMKTIAWPFVSDDATCYALLGRYFYTVKSVVNYPMQLAGSDGLIIAQKHPPGQILFYTLSALFAGTDGEDFAWRSVAFYYLVILVLMVGVVSRRVTGRSESGWIGVLVLLGTPVITWMTIFNTLDPARLAGMLAAVYAFHLFIMRPSLKMAFLVSIIVAATIFIHLAGCLLFPLIVGYAGADWVFRRLPWSWMREKIPENPAPLILTVLILLLSIIPLTTYLCKLIVPSEILEACKTAERTDIAGAIGLFIDNVNSWWVMPKDENSLSWMSAMLSRIRYNSLPPRLQPFTNVVFFSVTFWLWLGSVVVLSASRRRLTSGEYFFLMTTVLGVSAILPYHYANPRYVTTLLSQVCVVVACAFAACDKRRFAARKIAWCGMATYVMLASLTPFAVVGTQKGNVRELFQNDTEKRLRLTHDFRGAPDYFRALEYIREHIPPKDHILVFRHAVFFFYTKNNGIVFKYSQKLDGFRAYYDEENKDTRNAWRELNACGCKYILTDPAFTCQWESYRNSVLPELYKSELMRLVYQSGEVYLYQVIPDSPDSVHTR